MAHGGKRKGAGRPQGKGRWGEPTKVVRLPESVISEVMQFVEGRGFKLPMYSNTVQAGFPSPAEDYIESEIDLNAFLVKQPSATFLVRAAGNSMKDAGISDGDILVVDRSVKPVNGKVVIAAVDGQLTVKFLIIKKGKAFLMPANADYHPIPVDPDNGVTIWGVVTSSIHQH